MDSKDTCGIYCIHNLSNNKHYIGKSGQIEKRWKSHQSSLKSNKHINKDIQNDWNNGNSEDFEFKLLKKCEWALLNRYENFYMLKYDSLKNGYNIAKTFDYSKLSIKKERRLLDKLICILQKIDDHEYYLGAFSEALHIPNFQTNILFIDLQHEDIGVKYNLQVFFNLDASIGDKNKIIGKRKYDDWNKEVEETLKDFYL